MVLFAVVKFTEGAWLIVIIFPVLVYTLIRLNRQYGKEAAILEDPGDDLHPHPPNYSRRVVLLLVDSYDLATIAAIRYAKSLHPSALRAVHFSLDSAAGRPAGRWPPSSRSTSGTRSRRSTPGGPGRRLTGSRTRLAPTRSGRCASRAGPPSRAGCRRRRSARAGTPSNVLACEVADSTGELTAVFYGRTHIPGLEPGRRVRLRGMVGIGNDGRPAMINPAYDLLG